MALVDAELLSRPLGAHTRRYQPLAAVRSAVSQSAAVPAACHRSPVASRRRVVRMLIERTGASVAGTLRADACDAAFSRWSLRVVTSLLPADM